MAGEPGFVSADRRPAGLRSDVSSASVADPAGVWPQCRGGRRSAALSGRSRSIAGLLFVGKVGAGAFAGLTITANILMSLVIDRFGLFGMAVHELSPAASPARC